MQGCNQIQFILVTVNCNYTNPITFTIEWIVINYNWIITICSWVMSARSVNAALGCGDADVGRWRVTSDDSNGSARLRLTFFRHGNDTQRTNVPTTHANSSVATGLLVPTQSHTWQETQLSLTNRTTHLCKRNGVANRLKHAPPHMC